MDTTREELRKAAGGPPVDKIIALENGELPEAEVIDLFQELIDTGLCWQLQGCYGRTARDLIDAGLCHPARAA